MNHVTNVFGTDALALLLFVMNQYFNGCLCVSLAGPGRPEILIR